MLQKITALLPMKGHSERVPGKNYRNFAGKPLFTHILATLLSVESIQAVIINTDSSKIAELAEKFPQVTILNRPSELCGDFVPMNEIIKHDLAFAQTEHILQTHSTNPLLTSATIVSAIQKYFAALDKHDSLFSVTAWQTRFYNSGGRAINHNPQELLRTQDLDPLYEENSCLYLFSKQAFQQNSFKRIGLKPLMFPISRLEAVDIDEEEDFILAETLKLQAQKRFVQ